MLTRYNTGGFAPTSAPEGFGPNDCEEAGLREAGVRVVERLFGPKDTTFTPGDRLYFVLPGTVRLYGA